MNLHRLEEVFADIKAEGYDVVLDRTQYCPKCSKEEIKYPKAIFKIRFSENGKYHEVETSSISDYLCLLAFLQDRRLYKDKNNVEEYLPEQIKVIQIMTGLGADLKIK